MPGSQTHGVDLGIFDELLFITPYELLFANVIYLNKICVYLCHFKQGKTLEFTFGLVPAVAAASAPGPRGGC